MKRKQFKINSYYQILKRFHKRLDYNQKIIKFFIKKNVLRFDNLPKELKFNKFNYFMIETIRYPSKNKNKLRYLKYKDSSKKFPFKSYQKKSRGLKKSIKENKNKVTVDKKVQER